MVIFYRNFSWILSWPIFRFSRKTINCATLVLGEMIKGLGDHWETFGRPLGYHWETIRGSLGDYLGSFGAIWTRRHLKWEGCITTETGSFSCLKNIYFQLTSIPRLTWKIWLQPDVIVLVFHRVLDSLLILEMSTYT